MAFATVMAADLAAMYTTAEVATSAVHTAQSGDTTTLAVLLDAGDLDEGQGADALGATAKIHVRVVDVATIEVGDTIAIGSDTWEVLWARLSVDGLEWMCNAAKR